MKKVMLLAAGLFFALSTFAQQADNKQVKKIEVTGSAEIEITPDELNLDISLREYLKGKTNGKLTERCVTRVNNPNGNNNDNNNNDFFYLPQGHTFIHTKRVTKGVYRTCGDVQIVI